MFGWWKRKKDPAPGNNAWGDYEGAGIALICPDCSAPHMLEETPQFRALLEHLCQEIGDSSQKIYDEFNLLGEGSWEVQPEEDMLKFKDAGGKTCYAHYGLIASWNETTHSWMWAWGMPEAWGTPEACLGVVRALCDRAKAEDWQAATERMLLVNEHEAWHLTKLAAHISDMPLVYRGKVNDANWHFYAIGQLRWAS